MLEVLIFIYQNYWDRHDALELKETDETIMAYELSQAGFNHQDILHAVDWVKDLRRSVQQPQYQQDPSAIRIFCELEREKINDESLNFLCLLQTSDIITAYERDLIIDRGMVLPQETLNLEDIRWITMMVLWDESRKQDYLFVEDALFNPKGFSLQ
jgi:Smg protein